MKVKRYKTEYDVFAISVSTEPEYDYRDRVRLYVSEDGLFGLGAQNLSDVEIIDNEIGDDFKFHVMTQSQGFFILWDHFSDIQHLARLIDLDPETVAAFEKARASRSAEGMPS